MMFCQELQIVLYFKSSIFNKAQTAQNCKVVYHISEIVIV